MRPTARWIAGLALLTMVGCATEPPSPPFAPRETRSGLVVWRIGHSAGKARVEVARGHADDLRLVVREGDARLTVERRAGVWTAEGPGPRFRWTSASAVPAKLEGWLSLAEACAAAPGAPDAKTDVRTGRFSARVEKKSGRLVSIELVTVATAQRFRAEFE